MEKFNIRSTPCTLHKTKIPKESETKCKNQGVVQVLKEHMGKFLYILGMGKLFLVLTQNLGAIKKC